MTDDTPDGGTDLARIVAQRTLGDAGVAEVVLAALIKNLGATGGRVYTLDLLTGKYISESGNARSSPEASFDARRLRSTSGWGPLETAAATGTPQFLNTPSKWVAGGRTHEYGSRVVLPVLRNHTVVGLVDLHGSSAGVFSGWNESSLEQAEMAMQQLANSYEARSVHRILEHTAQFKVSLYQREDDTVLNLIRFVRDSSGMQYAALRRLENDGSLNCIATWGFTGEMSAEQLTLTDLETDYIPFEAVVEDRDHWVAESLHDEVYRVLRERPELHDVRSFVACPVLIGQELWGVLSFAAAVEFEYSAMEVYSLRALANLAGVALEAGQTADDAAQFHYDDGRLMQAVLSNEVVVATRHEMWDQLAIVGSARSAILEVLEPIVDPNREADRLTRKEIQLLIDEARNLDAAHAQISKVMETIRFSQSEIRVERVTVSPREVWERAIEPFGFRIRRSRVSKLSGDTVPATLAIAGSSDWLRIVFMHLLLNSFDAFDRNFEKGKREIVLTVKERTTERVTLRYYDNAGGIRPRTLLRRGETIEGDDLRSLIFERYVTSKERGTGLGLASCRAALATMNGSIDLVDWHRGITFDITLDMWGNG